MLSRQKYRRPQHKTSQISSPPTDTSSKPKSQTVFSDVRTGWPKSAFTFSHFTSARDLQKCYFKDIDDKIHIYHDVYSHDISPDNFDYGPTPKLNADEKPHHPRARNLKNSTSSTLRNFCTRCPSGPIPFPTRRTLAHHKDTVHRCPSCHWVFPTLEDRRNHIHAHHSPSTLSKPPQFPFTCCGQVFTQFSEPSLDHHRWKSHGTSRKVPYTPSLPFNGKGYRCRFLACTRANLGYMRKEELDEHILEAHEVCQVCDRTFKDAKTLEQHLRQSPLHVGQDDMRCLECNGSFGRYQEFAEHICWIPCQRDTDRTCFFEARRKQELDEHQRKRKHGPFQLEEKKRALKCPGCLKMFKTAGGVVAHLESGSCDSGINRRVVEMAVQRFDTTGLIHDGEKLKEVLRIEGEMIVKALILDGKQQGTDVIWPCHECEKVFAKKDALRKHLESPVHRKRAFHCTGEEVLSVNDTRKDPEGRIVVGSMKEVDGEGDEFSGLDDCGVTIYEEQLTAVSSSGETASTYYGPHRRFKTLSGLATHIEASESSAKAAYGNRLLLAAIERVADRMEAMSMSKGAEVVLRRKSAR